MGLGLRDLRVWQEGVALAADVATMLKQTNRKETRIISDHAMEAALQCAEHIAEGYGRYAPSEQRQLYREAKRHLLRLETSLAIARQAGVVDATKHAQLSSRIQTVNRLLAGFLVYLDRQIDSGNGGETTARELHGVKEGDAPEYVAQRCNWYAGCDELASTEKLCAFHLDACERPEHAERQRQHEARQ